MTPVLAVPRLRTKSAWFVVSGAVSLTLGLAVMLGAPSSTAAHPFKTTELTSISSPNPLDDSCAADDASWGAETEPTLALDPRKPKNMLAAWQQDRSVFGGAVANVIGRSTDGGRHWSRVSVPGLTTCNGGDSHRATDPWLSIGPDGTAYLGSLTIEFSLLGTAVLHVAVSQSDDGGRTWDTTFVDRDLPYLVDEDKEIVTADPSKAGTAYALWSRPLFEGVGGYQTAFTLTRDGGETWTKPRLITPQEHLPMVDFAAGLLAAGEGRLIYVYNQWFGEQPTPDRPNGPRDQIMATFSTDSGETWSTPQAIGARWQRGVLDPEKETMIRTNDIGSTAAIGRDGTAYAAWQVIKRDRSAGRIVFARSTDGGRTWSPPAIAARGRSQKFTPTIAVARDGTVGITYYDFRRDEEGDRALTTDVWFAHSHNEGRTWSESKLAGPFNMRRTTPSERGPMVGEYEGLVARRHSFSAAFTAGPPMAEEGRGDIYYGRLRERQHSGGG